MKQPEDLNKGSAEIVFTLAHYLETFADFVRQVLGENDKLQLATMLFEAGIVLDKEDIEATPLAVLRDMAIETKTIAYSSIARELKSKFTLDQ